MEPDGSLCRITSSYKDFVNNVRIVKEPGSDPCIRLKLMKLEDTESESEKSSDIDSDSSASDDEELRNLQISAKSADKDSGTDTKINNSNESKKDKGIGREPGHNYRSQTSFKKNYSRNHRNKFNKTNRSENVSNLKRNYNYSKQDYNHPVTYNKPIQHSDEISPWIDESAMLNYQFSEYGHITSHPKNLTNSVGPLGDPPLYVPILNDQSLVYFPISTHFQPNSNNKNSNSPYSSMTPNFASNHNSFLENQSASYSQMSSHYPSNNSTNNQNYRNKNYSSHNKNHRGRNRGRGRGRSNDHYGRKKYWNKKKTSKS